MGWIYLLLAGLMEIGWPLGIKLFEQGRRPILSALGALITVGLSGVFLWLALRDKIPMGTAYAVWTGIGTIGTFVVGVTLFHEPLGAARIACVALIAAGIIGLRLVTP